MTQSLGSFPLLFPDGRAVPSFLSVNEVAELFRISPKCVYDAIKEGELYSKQFSRRAFKVAVADAVAWFNAER